MVGWRGSTNSGAALRRNALRCVAAGLLVLLQWSLVSIPSVDILHFNRRATELQRTARWRVGYILEYHGATFVKTRMQADAPGLRPRPAGDAVAAIMARELRQRVRKGWLELAFYAGLFVVYQLGRETLRRVRTRADVTRLQFCAAVALAGVVFVTAAMTPYLLFGYGEPLFSNRLGPGAISSSGLIPSTAPMTSAISYGLMLQQLIVWPLMSAQWAADPLSAFLGIRGSLWFVAVMFWGSIGGSIAWLRTTTTISAWEQPWCVRCFRTAS